MKKNLLLLASAAMALALGSCAYDPYYSSTSIGGTYSTGYDGYGDGYGYGGSNFSTSVFVSTGDPRWGYDPYCYSYYDYRSRRYYDPYLNGYYPVGYRPPVVYGVPHPHGWRRGHGHMRPPHNVNNIIINNYRNREASYRGSRYGWARQVRQQPQRQDSRPPSRQHSGGGYQRPNDSRPTANRPQTGWRDPRVNQGRPQQTNYGRPQQGNRGNQNARPGGSNRQDSRRPSYYNSPVNAPDRGSRPQMQQRGRQEIQQRGGGGAARNQGGGRQPSRSEAPRGGGNQRGGEERGRSHGSR